MSNIYIQEPPAHGKVLLKTTVGDIDIELWTKETPKACRNFIQLCMEKYYNGTIFHRVVPDFIVQGGDPCGDGTGGESIYGAPFKDEFHSRLRFNRRGLVAMANSGKDDNGSQFFFTLNTTPELQNKHTLFGKITGETVFNMLKLAEGEIGSDERPIYPHKIIGAQILINPFEDIVPRILMKEPEPEKAKKKEKGVKNYGLLSFGMDAEEEEDQFTEFRSKPKSTHDLLNDPKLSKLTAKEIEKEPEEDPEEVKQAALINIRMKLKPKVAELEEDDDETEKSELNLSRNYYLGKDQEEERKKRLEEIREEMKQIKRELNPKKPAETDDQNKEEKKDDKPVNEMIEKFETEQQKYKKKQSELPLKGVSREQFTLNLLNKFKSKLSGVKEKLETDEHANDVEDPDDVSGDDWMAHKLRFEDKGEVLAKDASTKGDDWYDIYDPRNPINKRKRGEKTKDPSKAKSSKTS